MTDKETSLTFVERMETITNSTVIISQEAYRQLVDLAKTAALIEERGLRVSPPDGLNPTWYATESGEFGQERLTLHEAVRAVADKIKEGK